MTLSGRISFPKHIAFLPAAVALALTIPGCSNDDGDSSREIPSGARAKVGDVAISKRDIDKQVALISRTSPQRQPAASAQRKLRSRALNDLIRYHALEQEAADRGVEVTGAQVHKRWKIIKHGELRRPRALRRFLDGRSERDAMRDLRFQLLTEGIYEAIATQAGGGTKGVDAVTDFQEEFYNRWSERTTCRKGHSAALCK